MKYFFNSIITGSKGNGDVHTNDYYSYRNGNKGVIVYTCPANVSYTIILSFYVTCNSETSFTNNIVPTIYKNGEAFVCSVPASPSGFNEFYQGGLFSWINNRGLIKDFLGLTANYNYNNIENKAQEPFEQFNNIILNSGDKFGIRSIMSVTNITLEKLSIFFSYIEITK